MSIITCPHCKMRVFPKADGTCPSCQVLISQIEKEHSLHMQEPVKEAVKEPAKARLPEPVKELVPETSTPPKPEPAQPGAQDTAAAFCHHCGTPLLSEDNFCTKCGAPRRGRSVEQPPPAVLAEYRPAVVVKPAGPNLADAPDEDEEWEEEASDEDQEAPLSTSTQAVKVSTKYFDRFNMPPYCVMCGKPAGQGTLIVNRVQSNWSGKQSETAELEFPLCDACHKASRPIKDSFLHRLVSWIGNLLCIAVLLLTVTFSFSDTSGISLLIGVPLTIVIVVFLSWWSKRGTTPEQRERFRLIHNCVKILSFKSPGMFDKSSYILFKFENAAFGTGFAVKNRGEIR